MAITTSQAWLLVIAACALAGWWLSMRPAATYRGAGPTMQWLIILMATLMCLLAIDGQHQPNSPTTAYVTATTGNH